MQNDVFCSFIFFMDILESMALVIKFSCFFLSTYTCYDTYQDFFSVYFW